MRRDAQPDVQVRPYKPQDAEAVRTLILTGLQERWGTLDPSMNPDLNDFTATYGRGVTLNAWLGSVLSQPGL